MRGTLLISMLSYMNGNEHTGFCLWFRDGAEHNDESECGERFKFPKMHSMLTDHVPCGVEVLQDVGPTV